MKTRAIVIASAIITLFIARFGADTHSAFAEEWRQPDSAKAKILVRPQDSSRLDQTLSEWLLGAPADRQEALYALPCKRTQEVVSVPLENGGTNDVTVTSAIPGQQTSGSADGKSRKITITRC